MIFPFKTLYICFVSRNRKNNAHEGECTKILHSRQYNIKAEKVIPPSSKISGGYFLLVGAKFVFQKKSTILIC